MPHMNFDEALGEFHKDDMSCFERILGAASNKQQLYSYLLPISLDIQVR